MQREQPRRVKVVPKLEPHTLRARRRVRAFWGRVGERRQPGLREPEFFEMMSTGWRL